MKRYLPFIIIGAIGLATLGGGAMLYLAKRPHPLIIPGDKSLSEKSDGMHIRGNPHAPVTLEEFGDFQCPPCRNIAGFIDELEKEYHPRLRVVFRDFPLPNHKHARDAALAAEAADLQGRFWEMHDVLYREQASWSEANNVHELFDSYAAAIGLNVGQFKKDMDGEKAKARVNSDQERGKSLGVSTTPTLFINNREVGLNDRSPAGLHAMIDATLKAVPPASEHR